MHTERLCWVVAGGPNTYKGLTVMKHNETQGLLQTSSQTTLSETKITNRGLEPCDLATHGIMVLWSSIEIGASFFVKKTDRLAAGLMRPETTLNDRKEPPRLGL